jgi:PKD repeat protein
MKKFFSLLILLAAFFTENAKAQACCPEFELQFKRDRECMFNGTCATANGAGEYTASMCKYSTNSFLVTPNLPGFIYTWTISGAAAPLSPATGNPLDITWGGGNVGTITVTITSIDSSCKKTITEKICLRDAPKPSFTFTKDYDCSGTPVSFTNTSVGGASVYWDFGDGTFDNVNNPIHTYGASGNYVVTLYVSNATEPCGEHNGNPTGGAGKPCCGCVTIFRDTVHVIAGNPLSIVPKGCINQCLCVGDTSEYCASKICTPYNWSVSGGTIISGLGTSCIKVKWTGPYPTRITLVQPGCGAGCSDTAILNVPVLVNNIPIMPNTLTTVCTGTTQTYSLPAMPGVFYTWTVIGGTIVGPSINTASIAVIWNTPGSGNVSCTYQNPLKPGCSGSSSHNITVKDRFRIAGGPLQTCVGCVSNFNANGTANWSVSPLGATVAPPTGFNTVVSFTAQGTYTLLATASPASFCNVSDSATIVVAPKPILTITPSAATACPGTPVKFVASSNVTTTPISWLPLPAGATMIANTGAQLDTAVIQFSSIPGAGVTVTASQKCAYALSCSQSTATAIVKKPQPPVFSTGLVTKPCIDQTENYTISNYIPGIYYTWAIVDGVGNPSNLGTIMNGQGSGGIQILWHGNPTNLAFITVTNCAGSVTLPIQVILPVFPTISVSGSCFNPGITLTSSPGLPTNLWSNGQTGASITINQPGTYTVTVNPGALGSCPQSKTIVIPPNPYWVKIIPPCSVASCNLANISVLLTQVTNIPSPANCQWMYQPPSGGPYTIASNVCGNYTATLLGNYYEIITDPNGCKDTSNIIRIPQDINFCCATAACSSIPANAIDFAHSGCSPTNFTGTFTLPPGWQTGTLPVTYCYGDGTSDTGPSLNATHQYAAAGLYHACITRKLYRPAPPPATTNDTCCVTACHDVIIPVVAHVTASYDCNTGKLTMTDASTYYPNNTGASYTWTYPGAYTGTITNGVGQTTQVITPTVAGTFTITLSVTLAGCTSTATTQVIVVIPSAPINITPNPSCFGSPVNFTCTANGMAQYYWQFGDGSFSYLQNPEHIYTTTGTFTVTLKTTTPEGCVKTNSATVVIQPRPIVTLSPNPVTICPGSTVLLTPTINANGNTMCPTLASYSFQWYKDSVAIGGPTGPGPLTVSTYGNYYAVLTGTGAACNCKIITDTVVVKLYPKPIARIIGRSTICLTGGTGTLYLSNADGSLPAYLWSSNNPPNVTFSPNNAAGTNVTINAPGNYQVYLEVTDANGCKAYDTLCIYAKNSPTVTVSGPGGSLCAGNTNILTATPNPLTAPPAGYAYLWSNMATTSSINAFIPGSYNAIVVDRNTGCAATSNTVIVNAKPDLSLFPSCCDTICDNAPINIVAPLPLAVGQNACAIYNIVWLDNGVPLSPQPPLCNTLNTATLIPQLGLHNISIIVTINGCPDTSNVFNLFIKHCGDCDCKGSHWGEIKLTQGEKVPTAAMANIPVPIFLKCKENYTINCNQPYTINANYICRDTACNSKVTFSLQPPTGLPVTGTLAYTFTPTQSGTYTLTLYGWCGDKKCDSCVITFRVICDVDCCKGSYWKDGPNWKNEKTGKTQKINCGKTYTIKGEDCNTAFTVSGTFICADPKCTANVVYNLYDANTNTVVAGPANNSITIPANLPNGSYYLTIYAYCGTTLCDSCSIKIVKDCNTDCCKGSHWGDITLAQQQQGHEGVDVKANIGIGGNAGNTKLNCDKEYTLKCRTSYIINASYICAQENCPGSVLYNLTGPMGSSNGTVPFTFTPAVGGVYTLTLSGYCGGILCNTCKIIFKVECDSGCCPYSISVAPKDPSYSNVGNATSVNNNFVINGLSTANITEVRANVMSYTITDNFNTDCMKCINLPFTWASVASATNIGVVPAKITMYGGTMVPSFAGTGPGAYQNPREVIWNNGANFNIPNNTSIGMNFLLPLPPTIDCCELKGKICVKFTFRDDQCKECEVIACFDFVIKKK